MVRLGSFLRNRLYLLGILGQDSTDLDLIDDHLWLGLPIFCLLECYP